jgi:hypothetical protein
VELALNLAWLLIAVTSYALLARHLASVGKERASGPSRCVSIVALSCALVILFPIISLTDDLHDMQVAVEEPTSCFTVMKKCGVNRPLSNIDSSHHLPYTVSWSRTSRQWLAIGLVAVQRTLDVQPPLTETSFGRSPPFFDLS